MNGGLVHQKSPNQAASLCRKLKTLSKDIKFIINNDDARMKLKAQNIKNSITKPPLKRQSYQTHVPQNNQKSRPLRPQGRSNSLLRNYNSVNVTQSAIQQRRKSNPRYFGAEKPSTSVTRQLFQGASGATTLPARPQSANRFQSQNRSTIQGARNPTMITSIQPTIDKSAQ